MAPVREKKKTSQKTMLDFLPSPKNRRPKPVVSSSWRLGCDGFSSVRIRARKRGLYTDIQFVMGKGDLRKEFHAHKSLLAFASPVFECMFYGPMAEKRTVIETDDDPEAFDMLLNYIYGGDSETKFKSLITACNFFLIADKYLVYNIQKKAKDCIKDIYDNDNDFWHVIQESSLNYLCPLLHDKFYSYVMENTEEFFETEKWLNAPETVVENILQMDKLNIDEYSLLVEVTKWAFRNKKTVTSKILMQYYKHIRFSTLSSNDLIKFIEIYPRAFAAETFIEILRHVHGQSNRKLPKWCATSKMSRRIAYMNFRYAKIF